ncbi:MAG: aspartate dehydrogenase [Clostridiales bacterium]|nr:aspartate dehydrogenase [Clostridiales bacterium]
MTIFPRKKHLSIAFDPLKEEPVIKKSICTGEATVGFVDKNTGRYRDIRKVSSPVEIEAFCEEVEIDPKTIRTIY